MNGQWLVLCRILHRNRTRLIVQAAADHKRKTVHRFVVLCNRRPQLIDIQLNKRTAINCLRQIFATFSSQQSVKVTNAVFIIIFWSLDILQEYLEHYEF